MGHKIRLTIDIFMTLCRSLPQTPDTDDCNVRAVLDFQNIVETKRAGCEISPLGVWIITQLLEDDTAAREVADQVFTGLASVGTQGVIPNPR
jgi:hypothetical protein